MTVQTQRAAVAVRFGLSLMSILAVASGLSAQKTPLNFVGTPYSQCDPSRVWMQADYLLWWTKGAGVPALVTTSPAGTPISDAGVLGVDGTHVLFGGESLNDSVRSGIRFQGGIWLDTEQSRGVDFHYLGLESLGQFLQQHSYGDPILARPLVDATNRQQAANLAAFPGTISGTLAASVRSEGLYGWGTNLRYNIAESCSCCGGRERLDLVIGYRNANLSDEVRVREFLASPLFAAGTQLLLEDYFATRNIFHGANLGMRYEKQKAFARLNVFANVALGSTESRTVVAGRTRVTAPGTPAFDSAGGLLALSSNSGHRSQSEFTALFDMGFDAGIRVHQQFELHLGYTFLFWPDVQRAGDQIDTAVNPNLLPPPVPGAGAPARPAVRNKSTHFWAQGISFGFEYRY